MKFFYNVGQYRETVTVANEVWDYLQRETTQFEVRRDAIVFWMYAYSPDSLPQVRKADLVHITTLLSFISKHFIVRLTEPNEERIVHLQVVLPITPEETQP